jgi:hypothetical protein
LFETKTARFSFQSGFQPQTVVWGWKIAERQNIYILEVRGYLDTPPKGGGIWKIEIFFVVVVKNINISSQIN